MKNLATLLLLVAATASLWSQNNATYSKVKYYVGDSLTVTNSIESVIQVDSFFYFASETADYTNNQALHIIKTDLRGKLLDHYQMTDSAVSYVFYYGKGLILDKDSNLVVCCYKKLPDNRLVGYVIKLNLSLDTLWTKTLIYPDTTPGCTGNQPYLWPTAIQETLDGGYIIAGQYYYDCSATVNSRRSFLLKLGHNGNEQWRKMYLDRVHAYGVAATSDSGYVFPDFFSGYYVSKTNYYGDILWNVQINNEDHYATADIVSKDNYTLVTGLYKYNKTSDPNLVKFGIDIAKLDNSNGNIIWYKQYRTYRNYMCVTLHQDIEIAILDNDDIIIAGNTAMQLLNGQLYDHKGLLFKLNSAGDSLWCRFYNVNAPEDMSQFNDVIPTNDGGFLAVGFNVPYNYSYRTGAVLVKTDFMGLAPNAITLSLDKRPLKKEPVITIFPNPADEIITLKIDKTTELKQGILHIYNTDGKQVLTHEVSTGSNKINVSKLRAGIYYYTVYFGNYSNTSAGKLIVL